MSIPSISLALCFRLRSLLLSFLIWQDILMKSTLDSIFKVGFGVDLNSLSASDEFGNRFSKAFDDSNFIVYWRYVDVFWRIKRFINIGLEASLKENIKVINDFIFELI
jgi:hypothetical protein